MATDVSFKVLNRGKDFIEFEVLNNDNTILKPLVEELSRDPMVVDVKYHIEHPTLDNPRLFIKVKEGKPQSAIKRALKKIEKVFEDLEEEAKKQLGS